MRNSVIVLVCLLALGCTSQKVSIESPGCSAKTSAGGGGGGAGSSPDAPGSEGAAGGESSAEAGCTPGKVTTEQALGSGFLPTQ